MKVPSPLSDYVRGQVTAGLQAEQAAPVGTGYAQAIAGYTSGEGLFARAEVGWHPAKDLSLFAYGEDSVRQGLTGGAGLRLQW